MTPHNLAFGTVGISCMFCKLVIWSWPPSIGLSPQTSIEFLECIFLCTYSAPPPPHYLSIPLHTVTCMHVYTRSPFHLAVLYSLREGEHHRASFKVCVF